MTVDIKGLGKIIASEEVLNEIALAFYHASDDFLSCNRTAMSECFSKRAHEIYKVLDAEDYYKDVK